MLRSLLLLILPCFFLCSCFHRFKKNDDALHIGLTADYPPFEFYHKGELTGLSIDIGKKIATVLNKKVIFDDMGFHLLFPALSTGKVDLVISSMNATPDRLQSFDFSQAYYKERISMLYRTGTFDTFPPSSYNGIRIGCQLGTSREAWAKKNLIGSTIFSIDTNPQLIEALKASQLDIALLGTSQALLFLQKNNSTLSHYLLPTDLSESLKVMMKKNSPLIEIVNATLQEMEISGALSQERLQYWIDILKNDTRQ